MTKNKMDEVITVKVPFTGKLETFRCLGRGAYPYDCVARDRHPDSLIYVGEAGGWVPSHDLEPVFGGEYYVIDSGKEK